MENSNRKARKKRDPGEGITLHRHYNQHADDGMLFSKLIGTDVRIIFRKPISIHAPTRGAT